MIGNLMSLAQGVVGVQAVQLRRFKGQTTNSVGHQTPILDRPKAIRGHCQPIPKTQYEQRGLNFEKEYITLYTPDEVSTVKRDGQGDRVLYNGRTFVAESGADWMGQAGWVAVVCTRVPE